MRRRVIGAEHRAAVDGGRATGEAGARAAGRHGDALPVGEFQDGGDLGRVAGPYDGERPGTGCSGVVVEVRQEARSVERRRGGLGEGLAQRPRERVGHGGFLMGRVGTSAPTQAG